MSSTPERANGGSALLTRAELEVDLLSGLLADPAQIPHALESLDPADFTDSKNAALYRQLRESYAEGREIGAAALCDDLRRSGRLERAGGPDRLAEILDGAYTGALVPEYAQRLRRMALEAEAVEVFRGAERDGIDADSITAARQRLEQIEQRLRGGQRVDVFDLGISGDRLRALRDRPEPESPLPGLLDPESHVHTSQGKPKTAKTALALKLGRDWALGVPPWKGAPALPGTRVLIVSREQTAYRIDKVLRRLSMFSETDGRETWTDRISIVARDAELSREARALLTLDADGLAALRRGLDQARESDDPIGLVILDSLSRLKPRDLDENSNDAMAAWLDRLDEIAVESGAYILLIHHVGHSGDPGRSEARSAGRGASAIAACSQVVWLLERIPTQPGQRLLKVDGNAVLPAEVTFEVCGEDAELGSIFYFRPIDPLDAFEIDDLVRPGDELNVTALAWRVMDREPEKDKRPSGQASKTASALMTRWERDDLGKCAPGPQGSRLFQRGKP